MLAGRHPDRTIDEVFGEGPETEQNLEYIYKFEKLLDHLHLIAYAALDSQSISIPEVDNFCGWHLQQIRNNQRMVEWCDNNDSLVTRPV